MTKYKETFVDTINDKKDMTKVNPFISWWVTPKLPPEDVFARHGFFSQWISHPIKRRLARVYLKALQMLTGVKVIAVTGSTGKTTTTEILASILKQVGKTVWSSEGVDPVYNIPNTILKANLFTKFIILEMSVEYFNEMNFYLWLASPDVGIVTNIAATHILFLKNKEGVASEKSKLIKSLGKNDFAILNAEDELVKSFAKFTKAKVSLFGGGSEVSASKIVLNQDLSTSYNLKINKEVKDIRINAFGKQFVDNSLAASAAATCLGVKFSDIVTGIECFKPPSHRLNVFKSKSFGIIFDDSYNSNPKAADESLDTFNALADSKFKVAVVGDMLEMGRLEEQSHKDLGKKIGEMKFDCLVGVGSSARYIIEEASKGMSQDKCYLVSTESEALPLVKPLLNKNSAIFVKGSRSIHLDRLVDSLI